MDRRPDDARLDSDSQETRGSTDAASRPDGGIFALSKEHERAAFRAARRRAAIWGLATGGVMALIVGLCVLLLFLASSRAV